MNKYEKGHHYETKAKNYLEENGLKYLERNFTGYRGEIDLIFLEGETLVFVEVKYRGNKTYGTALEAVDTRKAKRIYLTAMEYLNRKNIFDLDVRFDLISFDEGRLKWTRNIIWGDCFEF